MRTHLSAAVFVLLLAASVSRTDDNSIEMLSRDWHPKVPPLPERTGQVIDVAGLFCHPTRSRSPEKTHPRQR